MGLKKGIDILKKQVNEQLEFIEWLKSKELYNGMESAVTMRKMQAVWKAAMKENEENSMAKKKLRLWEIL